MEQQLGEFVQESQNQRVREFFEQHGVYRRMVEHNYVYHQEVYKALQNFIRVCCPQPFTLVDAGSGDAAWMAKTLQHTQVLSYAAIDISPAALDLARRNMAHVPCDQEYHCMDFSVALEQWNRPADILWLGLSLHHLPAAAKAKFFHDAFRLLRERKGHLVLFDPFCLEGKTVAETMQLWSAEIRRHWSALVPHEIEQITEHVVTCDILEMPSALEAIADAAGYVRRFTLFENSTKLYRMVSFGA